MTTRALHRTGAFVLGAFVMMHLANHLVLYSGAVEHIALMEALRSIYRLPLVEAVLLAAVLSQMVTGAVQLRARGLRRLRGVARWQVYSGAYLLVFLLAHLSAVLVGRLVLGLDTNLYFAAAGYRVMPAALFFYPYYFLAVWAVFVHLGAFVWMRFRQHGAARADQAWRSIVVLGLIVSLGITAAMSGLAVPFEVPASYLANYQ